MERRGGGGDDRLDTTNYDRTNYDSEYPPMFRRNIAGMGKGTRFHPREISYSYRGINREKRYILFRSIYTTNGKGKNLKLLDAQGRIMSRDTERSHLVIKPLFSYSKLLPAVTRSKK